MSPCLLSRWPSDGREARNGSPLLDVFGAIGWTDISERLGAVCVLVVLQPSAPVETLV
jgi:hypothetical protein